MGDIPAFAKNNPALSCKRFRFTYWSRHPLTFRPAMKVFPTRIAVNHHDCF